MLLLPYTLALIKAGLVKLEILSKAILARTVFIQNLVTTIGNGLTRFYEWSKIGRVLQVLGFVANLHNAVMLSNNVIQSLLQMFDNGLALIGLKDKEGNPYSISQVIGREISDIISGIIGANTVATIKDRWLQFSTIYQSAMNTVFTITGMLDAVRNIVEIGAQYTGKIGNALKKSGTILENSYAWMHTDLTPSTAASDKWNSLFSRINNIEAISSGLNMVSADAVSIRDNITQLTNNRNELTTRINGFVVGQTTQEIENKLNSEAPVTLDNAKIGSPLEGDNT